MRKPRLSALALTFSIIPKGHRATPQQAGLMLNNLLQMQAQFSTAIHRIIDVERLGGFENFFIRPIVLDHQDFLETLNNTDTENITTDLIDKMMYQTFIDKEFEIQAQSQIKLELLAPEDYKELKTGPLEGRQAYRPAWKYRDTRLKINTTEPEKSLFEVRLGDYNSKHPVKQALKTLLYQTMLNRCWEMALKGEQFKASILKRETKETDKQYWQRMDKQPGSDEEALLNALNVEDPNVRNLFLGKGFHVVNPTMKVGKRPSFAFELEGYSEDLISVLVPRDQKLRAQWRALSETAKKQALKNAGFKFESKFTWDNYLALVTEFTPDIAHYKFLNQDPHLESSGNWEIKSDLKGFRNLSELDDALKAMDWEIENDYYGLHVHMFVPEDWMAQLTPGEKDQFVAFLERLSFMMASRGYAEAEKDDAPHNLDSWSLDRFSPKDLRMILDHLNGTAKMSSTDQKYHNVAYRPVNGGLDLELRDLGDDREYAIEVMQMLKVAIETKNFGGIAFSTEKPLFMEFKDQPLSEAYQYTLAGALEASGYKLTPEQKELLRKLQFEIYKPSMSDYVAFAGATGVDEAEDSELDPNLVRTNFENNLAMPLLNYSDQTYLSAAEKTFFNQQRAKFLKRVFALLKKVEKGQKFQFINDTPGFLHLADWLKRSTHADRPNFSLAKPKNATAQREILEDLTHELRGLTVEWVQATKVDEIYLRTLKPGFVAPDQSMSMTLTVTGPLLQVIPAIGSDSDTSGDLHAAKSPICAAIVGGKPMKAAKKVRVKSTQL